MKAANIITGCFVILVCNWSLGSSSSLQSEVKSLKSQIASLKKQTDNQIASLKKQTDNQIASLKMKIDTMNKQEKLDN